MKYDCMGFFLLMPTVVLIRLPFPKDKGACSWTESFALAALTVYGELCCQPSRLDTLQQTVPNLSFRNCLVWGQIWKDWEMMELRSIMCNSQRMNKNTLNNNKKRNCLVWQQGIWKAEQLTWENRASQVHAHGIWRYYVSMERKDPQGPSRTAASNLGSWGKMSNQA